jgi:predicted Zn-dependent protease
MSDALASTRRRPALPWALGAGLALAVAVGGLAVAGWFWSRPAGPKDHWEEVARARAYFERGRPDLAFQAVSGVRDEAPGAAEALTLASRALLMYGDVSTARKALERSLKLRPAQPEAEKMLAAIYLASGDGARGLALLKDAARLEPRDFRPWYAMGKVHHDLGELSEAAEAYAQALKRAPPPAEAAEARVGRVRALLDANRFAEAEAELDVARERMPDDPRVLGLAASRAAGLRRTAEVLDLADRALALDPDNFDARLARARVHNLAGRADRALADLEEAARIKPNDLGALQLLAQVQSRLSLTAEAEASRARFRKASDRVALMDRLTREIHQRPEDPEPRWRMGQAAAEGGMHTLAVQCYQAALDLDPNYTPAREALAALQPQGDPRAAPPSFRRPGLPAPR